MSVQTCLEDRERQQLQAQCAEITTLAGGLAHEIRNPLSTIRLNLELLGEDVEQTGSPRTGRMLAKIETVQRACSHLQHVLDAFLQFTRAGELELEDADLNDLVREFIEFYRPQAEQTGVEISPHLATDLPAVRYDRSLMRQVLMNLALNAQQAMPGGGLLELQTYFRDGRVQFDFIDTGSGMDERTRGRIFEAFFSTRPEGSGLGLPTVRRIVEAHGGTIACESEPARGTRFTIALPPADANG